jgi:hypothetical protein
LVRTNLETWLVTAAERDEYGRSVPLHVEAALRNYLRKLPRQVDSINVEFSASLLPL